MMKFYLITKRIDDVLERNGDLTVNELNGCRNRLSALKYLHKIYSQPSELSLTASDYKNLYDIFYLLSVQAYDEDFSEERMTKAKSVIKSIKSNPSSIIEHLGTIIN